MPPSMATTTAPVGYIKPKDWVHEVSTTSSATTSYGKDLWGAGRLPNPLSPLGRPDRYGCQVHAAPNRRPNLTSLAHRRNFQTHDPLQFDPGQSLRHTGKHTGTASTTAGRNPKFVGHLSPKKFESPATPRFPDRLVCGEDSDSL